MSEAKKYCECVSPNIIWAARGFCYRCMLHIRPSNELTGAQISLKFSDDYPYEIDLDENPEADLKPSDWAHRAARGVLADLCDRRGIKWELQKVDMDTRKDMVSAMSEIIRLAHSKKDHDA